MPARRKELSKDLKDAIIKLYKESKSQRQIVKIIGKSPATVQKIIEKFQAEGNTLNKPRTGRSPISTDRERRIIVGNVKKKPKISAPKLTDKMKNNFAKSCNPETIRRVLRKAGYHGRNMRRKPFVSKVNRKKRIDFAKENEKQDRIFWNSVIFSNESKLNIHGSDGHQKVWRKANAL
ncbi:transposable element Tc1 transposase [Trichonephila clavipes]|nr:transposable element Tc1 transposase [Trichonephila clavipes]